MDTLNYVTSLCRDAKAAAVSINSADTVTKNKVLQSLHDLLIENTQEILRENNNDLEKASENGVPKTMLDRLKLDEKRILGIANSLNELILLNDPVGSGSCSTRPNGLVIKKVCVPLGVLAIVFEARPNVTVDAAALAIKTGNAVVLRGGKEAINTNRVFIRLIKEALSTNGIDPRAASLIEDTTHDSVNALLNQREYIDVLIPRGGKGLIKAVVENAKVPVIETGAGNCHVYVDSSANIDMAVNVTLNAKVSRPSVCNAAETLLVHKDVAEKFLSEFLKKADEYSLELRGCERTRKLIPSAIPATEEDYYTEYNDMILAVKIVDSIELAIEHINVHSTGHSEAIITNDYNCANSFQEKIDSAAVYVNASTRFTDGGEFGFGAEIGISTQKLHARGPMGLEALTTVKYLISGNGQTR